MKKLLTLILASTAFAAMADDTAAGGVTTTTTPANQVTTTTATPTSTGDNSIVNGDGSGLYVGVGVGMGWNNQSFPTTTFRLDGGYNFNQFWAFEVGIITLTQSGGPFNQNVDIYDASIKGTLPLSQMFDVYGQFGGAYSLPGPVGGSVPAGGIKFPSSTQSSWSFMSGVGVDFNVNKNFAVNLSDLFYYGQSAGLQGNTDVLLLGLKYQF
ncbi:MAG TPA: outer membrane beta-barrel protein [Aquella sp.]|nr:outer membrane beta-barrel protein [Aquella sp.]